ncbi:MAG: hypothetical protein MJ211_16235, partial [Bacteroidales bacterium]|nr:hypothetical protein [Bacteroidales bacterium]
GHGVGNLEHAFSASNSSGKTQNLMDYSSGTELYHFQWDQIQDPSRVWMKWSKEESEGESKGDRKQRIIDFVKNFCINYTYKKGTETKFNEIIEENILSKEDNKYAYRDYIINIKGEVEFLSLNNIYFANAEYSFFSPSKNISISYSEEYTDGDIQISIFHEYLHRVNYINKIYPYRYVDNQIYTVKKQYSETVSYSFKTKEEALVFIRQNVKIGDDLFENFILKNLLYNEGIFEYTDTKLDDFLLYLIENPTHDIISPKIDYFSNLLIISVMN